MYKWRVTLTIEVNDADETSKLKYVIMTYIEKAESYSEALKNAYFDTISSDNDFSGEITNIVINRLEEVK